MQVQLNDEQAEQLRAVLDITLRDLSYEIASADLPTFRQALRHKRDIIRQILDAAGASEPSTSVAESLEVANQTARSTRG